MSSQEESGAGHEEMTQEAYDRIEIESLRHEVNLLKNQNNHLKWHCYVYRRALEQVPTSQAVLNRAVQQVEGNGEPPCNSCERDAMMRRIRELESALATATSKKRKCDSLQ